MFALDIGQGSIVEVLLIVQDDCSKLMECQMCLTQSLVEGFL